MPHVITETRAMAALLHASLRPSSQRVPVALAQDNGFAFAALVYKDLDSLTTRIRLVVRLRPGGLLVHSNGNFTSLVKAKQAIHVLALAHDWLRDDGAGLQVEEAAP